MRMGLPATGFLIAASVLLGIGAARSETEAGTPAQTPLAQALAQALDQTLNTTQWASTGPNRQEAGVPVAAATVMAAPPPSFFSFSDTVVSYRFQGPSAEPGIYVPRVGSRGEPVEVPKNVVNLFHADSWAYGTNLISLDILRSGPQDPAGDKVNFKKDFGATEVYLIYRGVLSPNKIFDTDVFAIPGLVKDIGLSFGADINTKDTTFDSEKRAGTFGVSFAFDVPDGFVNLKVQGYKEFSRNGLAGSPIQPNLTPGFDYSHFRSVEYKMTPEFELTYTIPLAFTGLPLALAGFNTLILPKGRYGFINDNQTQVEFVSQTNLVLDVGQLLENTPNRVEVFVGFQYWHNKFGGDPRKTLNTEEKALIAGVAYHLK
ncbi:hypothetical protein SAMN05216360_10723 [Methylobacterium phyllostachyos]|uniref:Uncharacterized protein n=1 Tax=Methylobacterium phyllostachyos TaxID=582672 RepID=A0A1H0A1E8_9HYPH|nr:hypothetical protein [Methylobacterium phyllostachyos]SDN26991.1 hypothetical protein SAMN05216360_10723 [Methylobacterium phyllostachyos]